MPSAVLSSRQFGRYFGRWFPCRPRFASAFVPPSLAPAFTRRHKPRPGLRPRLSKPRRNLASCGGTGDSSWIRTLAFACQGHRRRSEVGPRALLLSTKRSTGGGALMPGANAVTGNLWLASLRCPSPAAPFTGAGAPPSALTEANLLMPRLLEGAHCCFAWKARYGRGSPPNLRFEATSCPRS